MSVGQAEGLPADLLPSVEMKTQEAIDNIDLSSVRMKAQTVFDSINASQEEQPTADPKSGYLLKKGTMGSLTKRFFEINGEYLLYYKNKKKRKLLEAIPIVGAANIKSWDVSSTKEAPESSMNKTILIDLRDRQYILLAETVEDCKSWIKELLSIREAEYMRSKLLKAIDTLSIVDEDNDLDGHTQLVSMPSRVTRARSIRSSSIEKDRKDFLESVTPDYCENDPDFNEKWATIMTSEESKSPFAIEDIKSFRDSVNKDETTEKTVSESTVSIPDSRKSTSDCFSWLFPRRVDKKTKS
jgi:hypothetical protein